MSWVSEKLEGQEWGHQLVVEIEGVDVRLEDLYQAFAERFRRENQVLVGETDFGDLLYEAITEK